MARSEARIYVDIWDDPDFLALSPTAQRAFMFLLSQRDLSYAGVLALRERRWARSAAGTTIADVTRDLTELADARYVVVDEDTEELLIRSFIRRDKVYRQPNVLLAAADSLTLISSPAIRATLASELRRIAGAEDLGERSGAIVDQMLKELGNPSPNPSGNPSQERPGDPVGQVPSGNPSENPSGNPSRKGSDMPTPNPSEEETPGDRGSENPSGNPRRGAPGVRGVVTTVSTDSPSSLLLSPDPKNSPKASTTADDPDFERFWTVYPRKVDKGHARKLWTTAIKKTDAETIIAAAERYRDQPGRETQYTAHATTWLNGERWTDQPTPSGARSSPPGNGYRGPFRNPTDPNAYTEGL